MNRLRPLLDINATLDGYAVRDERGAVVATYITLTAAARALTAAGEALDRLDALAASSERVG